MLDFYIYFPAKDLPCKFGRFLLRETLCRATNGLGVLLEAAFTTSRQGWVLMSIFSKLHNFQQPARDWEVGVGAGKGADTE